jgi:hypothetical protein
MLWRGAALVVVAVAAIALPVARSDAAAAAANIDQCVNGANGNPPTLQPCQGSNTQAIGGFKNWVNGAANANNSHWQEGDFVPYRVAVSGVAAGSHTLTFDYSTVQSSRHAMDYLGSFDATETTAAAASTFHANNNNPCSDQVAAGLMPAGECTPATPVAQVAVTAPILGPGPLCNAPGTFIGTQVPGAIKMFGPAGSTLSNFTYVSQDTNTQSLGNCNTTVSIDFSVPSALSANQVVVIAWGGHIASEADWGTGNSASFINGSPFHMTLDTLDGASQGNQSLSLNSGAIFFAPSISTAIVTSLLTVTSVPLGTTVHDTATLSGASSNASGTVTYNRFTNATCAGTPPSTENVTVAGAAVPPSSTFTPSAVGSYSYQAQYTGNAINLAATSACEPLSVVTASSSTDTVVVPESPTSVHDTASVTGLPGFTPTGTLTYNLVATGDCSGAVESTQTVTLVGGVVPDSASATLSPGNYSFQATYDGDGNYDPSTSPCEPFEVPPNPTATATQVINDATGRPPSGSETTGSAFHDTATVAKAPKGPTPTGTVIYDLFNGTCTGSLLTHQEVPLANGAVRDSASTGPLGAGSYSFQATYSGDVTYGDATSPCEPFTVNQGTATLATVVFDAGTNAPWSGTEAIGAFAYDTATVTPSGTIPAEGDITYSLFANATCAGVAAGTRVVTFNTTAFPNSNPPVGPLGAGQYSFEATYSGDTNYTGTTGACEPFAVAQESDTATVVFDDAANAPWSGTETTSASAYDTATVTSVAGFTPTGTLTYTFFTNNTCSGTGTPAGGGGLSAGVVPNSNTEGPLQPGPYAFEATYSGDANYAAADDCEPFDVIDPSTIAATEVFDAATHAPWSGAETTGASAYDTAMLTNVGGFTPIGTVTYRFFTDTTCTGTALFSDPVTLTGGVVPNAGATGPLASGGYSFNATFGGDANHSGSTSPCEPFTVQVPVASVALLTNVNVPVTG